MLRQILILIILFNFFSCSRRRETKHVTNIIFENKTVPYRAVENRKSDSVNLKTASPAVNNLPFKGGSKKRQETYLLPVIKSFIYNNLDSLNRYRCTNGEIIDNSLVRLTKYRYRISDIGKYEVFYMCYSSTQRERQKDPLLIFIKNNCNMNYDYFGYLIFYDSVKLTAIVLDVNHSYYIDANEFRDFYIDKNGIINLSDSTYTDGDEDSHGNSTSQYLGAVKRVVSILPSGEITIKIKK